MSRPKAILIHIEILFWRVHTAQSTKEYEIVGGLIIVTHCIAIHT